MTASLTPADLFTHATLVVKLDIIGLVLAALAALAICAAKVASGPRLTGGSAFLSGLRLGGPLAGLLGGAYSGLNMAIGVANVPSVTAKMLAPGFAEALALVVLGLIVGVIAVIANWAVEARIDRVVLKA